MFNVAPDIYQLMARFEPSHSSVCLTETDRFLIPIVLFSEVGNCGSEVYSEDIPEPEVINLDLEEREEQRKKANAINEANAKPLPNYPEQISRRIKGSFATQMGGQSRPLPTYCRGEIRQTRSSDYPEQSTSI